MIQEPTTKTFLLIGKLCSPIGEINLTQDKVNDIKAGEYACIVFAFKEYRFLRTEEVGEYLFIILGDLKNTSIDLGS